MKPTSMFFISFAAMLILAGCAATETGPISGVVRIRKDYPLGTIARDIPFTSLEGKRKSFLRVKQPIAIVAFTDSPGESCCRLVPELVSLAHEFRNKSITVAQISLPTSKCSHGPGCAEYCNINDAHLVSLCDADRVAWKVYSLPKPNTLFLLDENNRITAMESLDSLGVIAEKARRLSDELNKDPSLGEDW